MPIECHQVSYFSIDYLESKGVAIETRYYNLFLMKILYYQE